MKLIIFQIRTGGKMGKRKRTKVAEEPDAKKVHIDKNKRTPKYKHKPVEVQDVSKFLNILLTDEAPNAWKDFLHKFTPQDEIISEYFSLGGQAVNLIRGFSKVSNFEEIATFFTVCRSFLLSIAGSEDPKTSFNGRGFDFGLELCQTLLTEYKNDIMNLLSMNNPPDQIKASLNVLTAMVTLGPDVSKTVISNLDWDHEDWVKLPLVNKHNINRISDSGETSIRTCYIHFLLSFLIEPSQYVLKEYFENKRTRLFSIFGHLMHDSYEVVMLILGTIRTKAGA
jgi:hypothetical protein